MPLKPARPGFLDHLQPGHPRHLDIHQHDIRSFREDQLQAAPAVLAAGGEADLLLLGPLQDHLADPFPDDLFIVDQHHLDLHLLSPVCSS